MAGPAALPTSSDPLSATLCKAGITLPYALREYQWQGVRFLCEQDAALLADEMGLGKTVQAGVAIRLLLAEGRSRRILIACPASLTINWQNELHAWAPDVSVRRVRGDSTDRKAHFHLPFQVWLASYEQVRADIDLLRKGSPYDLVVLDEAQRIKNVGSGVALATRQLPRDKSWCLTGTPVENKVDDLLSLFRFLRPGLLHSGLALPEIHARMRPHFLRRTKQEVLPELPGIISQDWPLEMEGIQREAYERERQCSREQVIAAQGHISEVHLLAQITRLKLLCNYAPDLHTSCKLEALKIILSGVNGPDDRVVVFTQFVDTIRKLEAHLTGLPVAVFHGEMTPEARAQALAEFQARSGPAVLLVSLRAGGVGLNINSASMVVLFDRWWNPAVESQAINRAHRYGRRQPLHVIRFTVLNTIEERIVEILSHKQNTFDAYIGRAEDASVSPFSRDELIAILGAYGG